MASFKIKGILSYPHLFQARAVNPGDDPKYSVTVLIAKTDPQVATVQAIIDAEKLNGFPTGFPATGKVFMKDCAVAFPDKPELAGYVAISGGAKVEQKPAVVDIAGQPVLDPAQVYAGAIAWVAFNTFCFNMPVNKGVGAGLNAVMLTGEEGELGRIDGRASVETLFADVMDGAAPVAPVAPVTPVTVAPVTPVAPVAPVAPAQLVMTSAANGVTLEQYLATPGWTEQMLIDQGLAIRPSFA